jgi:transcriptional regulator with XRE-family HTH domain
MLDHARENMARLMAARGLSLRQLAEQTRLDERTLRGILNHGHKPHIRTLHRLASGLGVNVDEFFVNPAQLLYRRFDQQTNPLVAKAMETHRELFDGWAEIDFDTLHRRMGTNGDLTLDNTLEAVRHMNYKRDLHKKFDQLLESPHAKTAARILIALHEQAFVAND